MTATPTHRARTTAIPRPRTAEDDVVHEQPAAPAEVTSPTPPAPQYPWPEPWRHARGARPRSEYWDVTTATWRSRGPSPEQRKG